MKKNKLTLIIISATLLLLVVATTLHLSSRTDVAAENLLVETKNESFTLAMGSLDLVDVTGQLINGKGELRIVEAKGIALIDILAAVDLDPTEINQVMVTAADEYSAVVTAAEIAQEGNVYLALQEDGKLQLLVFNDENSKRNVTDVERLLVE